MSPPAPSEDGRSPAAGRHAAPGLPCPEPVPTIAGTPQPFDLEDFLPYLLNQAAEATSRGFQAIYRDRHGMTRTQWRVMANLGRFGGMTARDICARSHMDKTRVSRAVAALELAGMLSRTPSDTDRRAEILALTDRGTEVFADLGGLAVDFDRRLRDALGREEAARLARLLRRLTALSPPAGSDPQAGGARKCDGAAPCGAAPSENRSGGGLT